MLNNRFHTQFDIPELMDVYSHQANFEIMDLNPHDSRCIIYFSSNGLYYPNQSKVFRREIIEKNRFEWKKNIVTSVGKAIFVRDVKKQWYLEGINSDINTIEKLVSFLKDQTRGLEVTCVGGSAGGYAATLVGHLMQASQVFNFSGQFSLMYRLKTGGQRARNPTLVKYENVHEYRRYFTLVDLINTSKTDIWYFFPARCAEDIAQSRLVDEIVSVHPFRFDTDIHGTTCYEINFTRMFSQDRDTMRKLYRHYRNSMISPFWFSVHTSGLVRTLAFKSKPLLQPWKRRIARLIHLRSRAT